jgi:transposase
MQGTPDWRSAPRNVFSTEFKLRMVELAQLLARISPPSREHGFNHNLLFKWLRLWQREGRVSRPRKTYNKTYAPTLLPVQVAPLPETADPADSAITTWHVRLRHGELTLHQPTNEMLSLVLHEMKRKRPMIGLPSGAKIWLVAGITDMRNGFNGLGTEVQTALKDAPMSGHVFIFHGRSGCQIKLLWSTGDGLRLLTKRLERGRFAWPSARDGKVFLTPAQLAMLLEGIDWRHPKRLAEQDARILALEAKLDAREREVNYLLAQLDRLRSMNFGSRSEKVAKRMAQIEVLFTVIQQESDLSLLQRLRRRAGIPG